MPPQPTILQQPKLKVPDVENLTSRGTSVLSAVSKWVPLFCATAAVGVGIIALKEIKNVRKELIILKKEQVVKQATIPETLTKKIEKLDEQVNRLTTYLEQKKPQKPKKPVQENVVLKNVVQEQPQPVNIINGADEYEEYEEVEVTDDEEN